MSTTVNRATAPAIRIRGLSKRFGATQALDRVALDVLPGRIHALIGLNGSGKSTLVKVLSGFHRPDAGQVEMGEVAFVHQDLGLLPSMTVLENMAIGRDFAMRRGRIDWRAETRRTTAALAEFGMGRVVRRPVATLTQAEQTIVAIARALDRSATGEVSALILDEPTSALPSREIHVLADAMRAFAARGIAVLFITHRLQEVADIADDLTVLRNGRVVFSGHASELDVAQMVEQMVGSAATAQVAGATGHTASGSGRAVLEADDVATPTLRGVSLTIRGGEITGFFGKAGSGVETIGAVLSGRARLERGRVRLDGNPLRPHSRRVREIGYVPSDRPHQGVFPGLTVRDNITLRSLRSTLRWGRISHRREEQIAVRTIAALTITPPRTDLPIQTLSGGNQQKAVLGRWLVVKPKAIVAEEPTQGIDVWAKLEILAQLQEATEAGAAVVLTAVEPGEILDVCHRVVVLRQGVVVLDTPRADLSVADILSAMH